MKIDSGIIKMLIVVFAVTIIAALILRHVMEKKGLYEPVETSVEETSEEMVDDEETKEADNESKTVSVGTAMRRFQQIRQSAKTLVYRLRKS